jgi:DNA-binding IscR family transcriptional regulator
VKLERGEEGGMAIGVAPKAALGQVHSYVEGRQTSVADPSSSLESALQRAFHRSEDTIKDHLGDETLADAGPNVQTPAQQLRTALAGTLDAGNCSSST